MVKNKVGHVLLLIVLVTAVVGVWSYAYIVWNKEVQSSLVRDKSIEAHGKVEYDLSLIRQTSLGVNNFKKISEREKLTSVMRNVNSAHFYGAFIALEGDNVVFSGKNGLADSNKNRAFSIGSSFFVGEYQDVLNSALLLHLIEKNDVKGTMKLSKYMSNVNNLHNQTIEDLLKNNVSLTVSASQKKFALVNQNKKITLSSGSSRSNATGLLKVILISKLAHMSYRKAFDNYLISPLNLTDTRFFVLGKDSQANDVVGYRYLTQNGIPTQTKMVNYKSTYFGDSPLRMSISDIVTSFKKITEKGYISSKHLAYVDSSLNRSTNSNSVVYTGESLGQYLSIKKSAGKIVLVVSNFPNKKVTNKTLLEKLFKLY